MTNQASPIDVAAEVRAAEERARPHLLTTPVVPSLGLSALVGSSVVLKCENLQHTGSFKARGAVSKVLAQPRRARQGRHHRLHRQPWCGGLLCRRHRGRGPDRGRARGRQPLQARVHRAAWRPHRGPRHRLRRERAGCPTDGPGARDDVHLPLQRPGHHRRPGHDRAGAAGAGRDLTTVFVAVGGGGLASGVAGIIKAVSPSVRVIGCSPVNSAVMYHSLKAGAGPGHAVGAHAQRRHRRRCGAGRHHARHPGTGCSTTS